MFSNRLGFAALGIACLAAAGVGGYVASRQNIVTPAPIAASAPLPAASPAVQPVQETEGIVGDTTKSVAPPAATAPTSRSSATKRSETPAPRPQPTSSRTQPTKPNTKAATTVAAQNTQPPALDRSWPSSSSSTQGSDNSTNSAPFETTNTSRQDEARTVEPPAPEPPAKTFEELVVAQNSVVGLQMDTAVTSDRARIEDRVEARVVRDVRVGGQVAIPAGSKAVGAVMAVDRGGKFKDRARLGIRFHTLVLADGTQVPISTETIYRYGDPPGNASAAKVGGGAVAGAILGAIIGGAKGAAIGSATGAGAGTAVVMAGDASAATFPAGAEVTARIVSPVTVTLEK